MRRLASDPLHHRPVNPTPSSAPRLLLPPGMGSRLAFALYAVALLGSLGAITALIERAAT